MLPPVTSFTTPVSHIVRSTSNLKRKDRRALVEERSDKLTQVTCVRGQGRLHMSELTNQEIVEWHDSNDDDYFSDDGSLFSKDENLLHNNNNDLESSEKDKLRSLFKLLKVPNDEIINDISNKGNHNLSRGLRVQQRMFCIANVINTELFELLCEIYSSEKLKEYFYAKGYNRSKSKSKLTDNLLT